MKRNGHAITVERRGTSSGIALRHLSCTQLHVLSAKDHTGRETAPRGIGFRGQTLKTIRNHVQQGERSLEDEEAVLRQGRVNALPYQWNS